MNKFMIKTAADGESFKVYLNGVQVGDADHDKNGWAGMEDVTEIVLRIAREIKAEVAFQDGE